MFHFSKLGKIIIVASGNKMIYGRDHILLLSFPNTLINNGYISFEEKIFMETYSKILVI